MKKFLSLVLALAMTMSLVTISAGAKDFTDADKITYVEAVEVMTAIGVVDGDTAGNFNPTNGLTRGAAAKIICNLILGPTTAAALNADANPYKDVDKNSTFAGYIAFCQKEGIISGYADGTFKPAAPLTGYAFMKMLLGALGYDVEVEGYTGSNWSINVAKRAINIGLNDGLTSEFNGSAYVTREEAMLYAFNALQADMVNYDTTITIGDVTVAGSKAEAMENNTKTDGNIDRDGVMQFAEKYFTNLKATPDRDDFYRPATTWKLKAETIGTYTDTPDLTYTAEVESGDIYSDLGSKVAKADVTVYVDGHKEAGKALAIAKGDETVVGVSANGVLTEVFYDADNETADIVQINTYVGEVDKTVKATDKKDAYIVIADTGVIATAPASNLTYETDEKFDDDTIVLYTYAKDAKEVQSVVAAEVVTGTVSRAENKVTDGVASQKVTLDGTVYSASAQYAGEEVGSITVKEDYDLYLDAYGYMIKVERVSDLSSDYALVADTESGSSVNVGGGFTAKRALLIFTDGTTKVVSTEKNYSALEGKIVTYKADEDGVYTLREVQNTVSGVKTAGTKFLNDSTVFDLDNSKSQITVGASPAAYTYSNSDTMFVIYNRADDEWTSYTGTKNVPSVDLTNVSGSNVDVYYYCKSGSMTTVMFIIPSHDAVIENNGSNVLFIAKGSVSNLIHDNDGDYYEYNAIVGGKPDTIKVDYSEGKNLNGFYNRYSTDKYGIYDGLVAGVGSGETLIGGAAQTGLNKTSAEYTISFGLVSGAYTYTYTVADDANIYYVDEDGEITESSYNAISKDSNDQVFAIVKDDQIKTLVIVEVDDDYTNIPVVNAENYVVTYSGNTVSDVMWYTGAAHDVETLLDVVLNDLLDKGYTDLTVSQSSTTFSIGAKRNNVTYTFTWTSTSATEGVKVQVDGIDMLVAKTATLNTVSGVTGTYAKGVKKDGTAIALTAMASLTVADGAAYTTGYVKVTFTCGTDKVTVDGTANNYAYLGASDTCTVTIANSDGSVFTGSYSGVTVSAGTAADWAMAADNKSGSFTWTAPSTLSTDASVTVTLVPVS